MPRKPNPEFMRPMTIWPKTTFEEKEAYLRELIDLEHNLTEREKFYLECNQRRFLAHLLDERKKKAAEEKK